MCLLIYLFTPIPFVVDKSSAGFPTFWFFSVLIQSCHFSCSSVVCTPSNLISSVLSHSVDGSSFSWGFPGGAHGNTFPEFLYVHNSFSSDFIFEGQFCWCKNFGDCRALLIWGWQAFCCLPLLPSVQLLISHGSYGPICPHLLLPEVLGNISSSFVLDVICGFLVLRSYFLFLFLLFFIGGDLGESPKKVYNYFNSTTYQNVWLFKG